MLDRRGVNQKANRGVGMKIWVRSGSSTTTAIEGGENVQNGHQGVHQTMQPERKEESANPNLNGREARKEGGGKISPRGRRRDFHNGP